MTGAFLAHGLTYLLALINSAERQTLLQQTGHSYSGFAAPAAVVFGVFSAVVLVGRHLRPQQRSFRRQTLFHSAFSLAAVQVLLFTAIEVGERLISGAPLGGLLAHGVFPLGLVIQVLVALGLALLLRGLSAVAELLALRLGCLTTLRSSRVWLLPRAPSRPTVLLLSGAWGLRGPPSA